MAAYRLIAVLLAALAAAPAAAASSAYTKLDLGKCREAPTDPDDPLQSGIWWCEGYAGIPVYVSEGDLRFFVSYGKAAESEPAAAETLPGFNTAGETIEWRLDGAGRPFATILRFFVDVDGAKSQVLVVTRLGHKGEVCRVGFVDAGTTPDANTVARRIADEEAPRFRCGVDEAGYAGESGD